MVVVSFKVDYSGAIFTRQNPYAVRTLTLVRFQPVASHQVRGRVRRRELRRFHGHGFEFVPEWALAFWTALRFVPVSRAILCFCFVVSYVSFFVGLVCFLVKNLSALSPNDVTGKEKRRKTDGHQTPKGKHLPFQILGIVWAQVWLAFLFKVHNSKIILLALPVRTAAAGPAFPIRHRAICRARSDRPKWYGHFAPARPVPDRVSVRRRGR